MLEMTNKGEILAGQGLWELQVDICHAYPLGSPTQANVCCHYFMNMHACS